MIPPAAVAVIRAALETNALRRHPAAPTALSVRILLDLLAAGYRLRPDIDPEPTIRLHHRQAQVLLGYARGLADSEIAAEMNLAPETIKTYGRLLRGVLGATCRAHAVAIGYETGLLRHGDVTTRPTHTTEPT